MFYFSTYCMDLYNDTLATKSGSNISCIESRPRAVSRKRQTLAYVNARERCFGKIFKGLDSAAFR